MLPVLFASFQESQHFTGFCEFSVEVCLEQKWTHDSQAHSGDAEVLKGIERKSTDAEIVGHCELDDEGHKALGEAVVELLW